MLKIKFFVPLLVSSCFFLSCKKDVEIKQNTPPAATVVTPTVVPEEGEASVVFNFRAMVNDEPLVANTAWYKNANGDSFTVSKFNYYISNIKFIKSDGTVFSEKESYHLNKHCLGKETFTVTHVPVATYASIEFLIGVDSLSNVSGSQTGDLDVKEDMFWDWSTGYIFFKLEGDYKPANGTGLKGYGMHVGGFGGKFSNIEKCVVPLNNKLVPKKDGASSLFFYTQVEEIFKNPVMIDLDVYPVVTNKSAKIISTNYKDMFELYKIEN